LAVVEKCARGIELRVAGAACWDWALAVGTKARESYAALVAMLGGNLRFDI
jgi:hypothetical protein